MSDLILTISRVHEDGSISGSIWYLPPIAETTFRHLLGKPDIEVIHSAAQVQQAMGIPFVSVENTE